MQSSSQSPSQPPTTLGSSKDVEKPDKEQASRRTQANENIEKRIENLSIGREQARPPNKKTTSNQSNHPKNHSSIKDEQSKTAYRVPNASSSNTTTPNPPASTPSAGVTKKASDAESSTTRPSKPSAARSSSQRREGHLRGPKGGSGPGAPRNPQIHRPTLLEDCNPRGRGGGGDARLYISIFATFPGETTSHWSLFLDNGGHSNNILTDIVRPGAYWMQRHNFVAIRPNQLPLHSRDVFVAPIRQSSVERYERTVLATVIQSGLRDWGSINWVKDALGKLKRAGVVGEFDHILLQIDGLAA